MAEAYINEHRQARQFAQDFLAANPKQHMAIITHAGLRLTLDQSGFERVDRVCTDCKNDIPGNCAASSLGEDGYMHFPEEPCYQAKEAA
ncbi:MAG: hypothetical protein Q8M84_02965 [Thiobacillus sp.]|nr:hypothetical protein [Thiobacillus sp.]